MMKLNQFLWSRPVLKVVTRSMKISIRQASGVGSERYDVIVIGGGHAGCEAATAAARVGASTVLLTHKRATIGEMSCNPSFGGIGKGHLMMEVDALDGVCGRVCDLSGIQYRVLNRSAGPAVWGPRAQIDRNLYKKYMQHEIFNYPNLDVVECSVEDLLTEEITILEERELNPEAKCRCVGVVLADGSTIHGKSVVLTAGTFLRGRICVGLDETPAGRVGDKPATGLAKTIEQLGFSMGRLKTGSPPRIYYKSACFANANPFYGDDPPLPFSYETEKVWIEPERQIICYTTFTKPELKKIIMDTLHLNKHVAEEVRGPRYCPSIESKVLKFEQDKHMCWLEPEGLEPEVIYLQGFSCTMPVEYQEQAVRLVDGLEKAEIARPGYGVEYDYMDPRQVSQTLQTYKVLGLYFAGQINGTTGYEEAAAQGLIAGVNAARRAKGLTDFTVKRSEGYIGVLIDDLTTLGTNEPYRMFTSRAEFRLSMRPDNADARLTLRGFHDAGCVSVTRMQNAKRRLDKLNHAVQYLNDIRKSTDHWSAISGSVPSVVSKGVSGLKFLAHLREPEQKKKFLSHFTEFKDFDAKLQQRVCTEALYSALALVQEQEIRALRKEENLLIPNCFDYAKLNVKLEIREKLAKARPQNIAAATRIQGVTPSALLVLIHRLKSDYGQNPVDIVS